MGSDIKNPINPAYKADRDGRPDPGDRAHGPGISRKETIIGDDMSSIETVKSQLTPWTSSYGEIRYYIEDWYPLVADVLDIYSRDEWMSPDLKKIKRAKVWFDTSARIHVDGLKDDIVIEIIRANIENRHFLRCQYFDMIGTAIRSFSGPAEPEGRWRSETQGCVFDTP